MRIIEYSPIASSESRLYLRFIESLRVNALYSIEGIQTERVPSTTLAGLNVCAWRTWYATVRRGSSLVAQVIVAQVINGQTP
jgi:hypothetical protein